VEKINLEKWSKCGSHLDTKDIRQDLMVEYCYDADLTKQKKETLKSQAMFVSKLAKMKT
jgi:hypothetical protein